LLAPLTIAVACVAPVAALAAQKPVTQSDAVTETFTIQAIDYTKRIMELTEGRDVFEGCLLGLKVCSDATACPVHHTWSPLKTGVLALLGKQTIGSMAEAVRAGRYRVAANRAPPTPKRRHRP